MVSGLFAYFKLLKKNMIKYSCAFLWWGNFLVLCLSWQVQVVMTPFQSCLVPQISIHRSWDWCVLLSWSGQASWSLASLLFFFLPSSLRELFSIVSFLGVYDRSSSFVLLGLHSSAIVVLLPSAEPAYLFCGPSSWSFPWGTTKQIATGVFLIGENCFTSGNNNISKLWENNFHECPQHQSVFV